MKRRQFSELAALAAMLTVKPSFTTAAAATAIGMHGMAVFGGREGLYASHLPMFHAPHDTQVLLRFHLADARHDGALRQALSAEQSLWTLDPEPFDLLRLAPSHAQHLDRFGARLVEGHFERGGTERWVAQTVVVDQVLMFKRLNKQAQTADSGRYLLIGQGSEWFAVKEINRRPDFDHILLLEGQQAPRSSSFTLALSEQQCPDNMSIDLALSQQLGPAWRIIKTLYFETGDLR